MQAHLQLLTICLIFLDTRELRFAQATAQSKSFKRASTLWTKKIVQ